MYINGINGYLSKFEGVEVDAAVERVQGLDAELALKVDKTTKINNYPLTGDITLTAEDVGALSTEIIYGKSLGWEDNIISLKDQNGRTLSSEYIEIDLGRWGHIIGTLSDQTDLQEALDSKQPLITASSMLSADLVDDTDTIHKFATAAQLTQIATNTTNIATNAGDIATINGKIPSAASTSNQLADKEFVNSSIATNTANFIGTFNNVSDLESYSGEVTNNDYAFVINSVVTNNGNDWASFADLNAYDKTLLTNFDYAWVIDGTKFDLYRFDIVNQTWDLRASDIDKDSELLNTAYNRYKATVEDNVVTWMYEYTLNNSSFTAEQWAAINSGANDINIGQISINENDIATINSTLGTFGNIVTHNVNEFATAAQGALAETALQSIDSTMVVDALGFTPENQANKVSAFSQNPNNTQYPTAKLVKDQLDLKQNNLTSENAGEGIAIGEVGGVLKISNTNVSAEWGNIIGTLSNQVDLQGALDLKQGIKVDLGWGSPTSVAALSPSGMTLSWEAIELVDDKFIAIDFTGYYSEAPVSTLAWTTATPNANLGNGEWYDLAYNGSDLVVAIGWGGYISTKGSGDWSAAAPNPDLRDISLSGWYKIIYGNNKFVALNVDGYTAYSTDGSTWTAGDQISDSTNKWSAISYGNNKFIALNERGYVSTSLDGVNWSDPSLNSVLNEGTGSSYYWDDLIYCEGEFIATEHYGRSVAISKDGVTWVKGTPIVDSTSSRWWRQSGGNGKIIALSANGDMSISSGLYTTFIDIEGSNLNLEFSDYNHTYELINGVTGLIPDARLSTNIARVADLTIEGLNDVSLSNLTNGQFLTYDSTSQKWVNGDVTSLEWGNITGDLSDQTDLKNALDGKQPTITGAATTITGSNLTTGRVLVSDSNGKVAVSSITSTKLGYLTDVTSNIQVQLNNKLESSDLEDYVPFDNSGEDITISADSINFYTDGGANNNVTINSAAVVVEGSNPTFDSTINFSSGNSITNETDAVTGDDNIVIDAPKVSTNVIDAQQYIVDAGVGYIDSNFSDPTTSADSLRFTDGNENNTIAISPTNIYIETDTVNNAKAYYNGEEIASKEWTIRQGYITEIDSSDVEEALGYVPQKELTAGDNIVITESSKGWTEAEVNTNLGDNYWNSVAYSGTKWVAIGGSGIISTSTDGVTWSQAQNVPNLVYEHSIGYDALSYGNNKFVTISWGGYVSSSVDGVTWEVATYNSNLGNQSWRSLVYDGTKFVALSLSGYISTSTDGSTWTAATYNSNLGNRSWRSLVYDGTKFVALDYNGYISTSTNGTTWTQAVQDSNLGNHVWEKLGCNGTKLVALGYNGYYSTSTDGTTWTQAVQDSNLDPSDLSWKVLFYNGTKFVAISEDGYTSTYNDSDSAIISAVIPDKALDDLTDVNLTNLTDGQYITYDSATQKWVNTTASVTTSLSGLTDVALSSLVDGQVLSYNSNTQKWVNGNALKNTATGNSSITVNGTATTKSQSINIGTGSQATGNYGTALGAYSFGNASHALGLGNYAKATADYAIQLNKGTNNTSNSLCVGFNSDNYQLLDGTTGLIPDARISSNIARSADLTTIVMRDWSVA